MEASGPVRVGLVGCGNISGVYLKNGRELPHVEVIACADLERERAIARAQEFEVPRVCSVTELLADQDVELVLNLTVPSAHADISIAALQAGKHVYSEKPLATTREDGRRVLETARQMKRAVGCAPDTFLGAGLQTARRIIDDGAIGTPVAATAFFLGRGQEDWHPNPEFFYQPGAGPLFDMGPYYLTALINLLGPVRAVAGMARISFQERMITSQPLAGTAFTVKTPTYVSGLLQFATGSIGTLISTFDVRHHTLPYIEIYGSEGNLRAPDPNRFGGTVLIQRRDDAVWLEATSDSPYTTNWRGLGLDDMAEAIRRGGDFRASGELGFHVLDVMASILASAQDGLTIELASTAERPAPLQTTVTIES